jgi:hypothetical protein
MTDQPSGKSLREDLRNYARKSGERQMDLLRINRKEFQKMQQENSAVAQELSRSYRSSAEQDGSRIAAFHKRRLDSLRGMPPDPSGFEGDFPWGDEPMPGLPPDGRPFDWQPNFPRDPHGACHYESLPTLDTANAHSHRTFVNDVGQDNTFNDDLSEGVNLCQPVVEITSLRSENINDPTLQSLSSVFRFRFRPSTASTYRFRPAAFVNGHAYTLEVGGVFDGAYHGPIWSVSVKLVTSVSQLGAGIFQSIEREILRADQAGGQSSRNVVYDSTSDPSAAISVTLDANLAAVVIVKLQVELSTINSFPSVRFDGAGQYFQVPEINVDKLVCLGPFEFPVG